MKVNALYFYLLAAIHLVILSACRHAGNPSVSTLKVIDGEIVPGNNQEILPLTFGLMDLKYRYQVPTCTATKIGPRHLITAARCLQGGAKEFGLALGSPARLISTVKIAAVSGHPSYFSEALWWEDDIAVLLTAEDLPASVALSVATSVSASGDSTIVIAGYGEHQANDFRWGPPYVKEEPGVVPLDGHLRQGEVQVNAKEFSEAFARDQNLEILGLAARSPVLGEGDSGGAAYLKENGKMEIIGINLAGASFYQDGKVVSREFSLTNVAKYLPWIECSFFKSGKPLPENFSSFSPSEQSCARIQGLQTVADFQKVAASRCQQTGGFDLVYERYCLPVTEEACLAHDLNWLPEQQKCDFAKLGFVPPPS